MGEAGVPPLADEDGGGYRCYSRVNVNHGPAREIECPLFEEPALWSPDPVGYGGVHEGDPDHQEDEVRGELEPLDKRACNEGAGINREHTLEYDKQKSRYSSGFLIDVNAGQSKVVKVAYEVAPLSEGEAIAPQDPD